MGRMTTRSMAKLENSSKECQGVKVCPAVAAPNPIPSLRSIVKKKLTKTRPFMLPAQGPKLKNPFLLPDIIKKLGSYGAQQDLFKLRQMSRSFYEHLTPIFLDHADAKIKLHEGSVMVGKRGIPKNWIDIAHIFRKIEFDDCWIWRPNCLKTNPYHAKIRSEIRSHITTLEIVQLGYDLTRDKPAYEKLSSHIGIFPNLKKIKLYYDMIAVFWWSMDELELSLRSVNANTKVTIVAAAKHEEILDRFGTKPNYTVEISACPRGSEKLTLFEFQTISNCMGHLSNWVTNLDILDVNSTQKLKTVATLSLRHQHQIKTLKFSLDLNRTYNTFSDSDPNEIRSCLTQLSPMITGLTILTKEHNKKWDLISGISWTKLSYLKIDMYARNFPFLKYCPALKHLECVGMPECIPLSYCLPLLDSDKTLLKEYFGSLPIQLNHLTFGKHSFRSERYEYQVKCYVKELL